jgi:hypothetical protein
VNGALVIAAAVGAFTGLFALWSWVMNRLDTSVAHPARVYDFLLGGADNFAVDREAAERGSASLPGGIERARAMVRSQRAFLASAMRRLAGELGVRQFLDIGTGIPNGDNVHVVAQQTAPASRVVYVDNDPVVLAHAHTLLKSTPQGATAYITATCATPIPSFARQPRHSTSPRRWP